MSSSRKKTNPHQQRTARVDLLPWDVVWQMGDVLAGSARKHGDENLRWTESPWRAKTPERHIESALRHVAAYMIGERNDPTSGKHHLVHASLRLMMAASVAIVREAERS